MPFLDEQLHLCVKAASGISFFTMECYRTGESVGGGKDGPSRQMIRRRERRRMGLHCKIVLRWHIRHGKEGPVDLVDLLLGKVGELLLRGVTRHIATS